LVGFLGEEESSKLVELLSKVCTYFRNQQHMIFNRFSEGTGVIEGSKIVKDNKGILEKEFDSEPADIYIVFSRNYLFFHQNTCVCIHS
jgi:hypothetical protein